MTRIVLIRCGSTGWSEQDRIAGATELPLSQTGRSEVELLAEQVRKLAPTVIYAGPGQATTETVNLLSRAVKVKSRTIEGLEEPSMGLWEGLTQEQLRQRSPKIFKLLQEQPVSVRPPMGEPLDEAADRIVKAIARICSKHRDETVGLVLGPVARSLLECLLKTGRFQDLWDSELQMPEFIPLPEVESTLQR